ncbi:aspartic peptidase domain-containing protein [Trametes elegans]|nr:aspartic peptidase domain-containing protein [Trametes elegans]
MQLALSFTTLLASILFVLSAADFGADAAPAKRAPRAVTLPLQRLHQNRGDVHPQVFLQQHINRGVKRIARMKGRAAPTKRDMEDSIARRLFVPPGELPPAVGAQLYARPGAFTKSKDANSSDDSSTSTDTSATGSNSTDASASGSNSTDVGASGSNSTDTGSTGSNSTDTGSSGSNSTDTGSAGAKKGSKSQDSGESVVDKLKDLLGKLAEGIKQAKESKANGKNKDNKQDKGDEGNANSTSTSTDSTATASANGTSTDSTATASANSTSTASGSASTASSISAAAAANGLTPAGKPTAANSLGLDIEAKDVGYIATIQMGTPPRDFKILMDSGSADLWVGAEGCQSQAGGGCGNHQFLGPKSSSSFKDSGEQFQVTYGTGAVAGNIIQDNINVAGLALDGHSFGVAAAETQDFSDDSVPFDGLMGLAQSTLSQQGVATPVEALAKAGLIDDAITSYKISRLADNKNDGEITFGALDETKFDKATLVTFDNVADSGFWEGAMDAVTVDGKDVGLQGRSAILDTGTTLIIAPEADAAAVHKAIPGAQSDGQGGFTIPCDTNASVALNFAGQEFAIDTRDLVFAQADSAGKDCISGISAGQIDGATTWLVGDVFLKNAYFSTDVTKNQMSLAKLV